MFLKLETVQPTCSFKLRGALNVVMRLTEQGSRLPPLVTASAGNHGRALAYAARIARVPIIVYLPRTAPRSKIEAIRRQGATLEECADYDEAEQRAKEHGGRGDALFISPYSHPDVVAGAGTVGLEILEERDDIDTIVVPVGGGGLISGIAIAARARRAGATQVTGVEVEASCPFTRSLEAGRIVEIDVRPTLADGLAGNLDPDTITFDIVRRLVERIVLVGEPDLRQAIRGLAAEERVIAEAAGAAGVAAITGRRLDVRRRGVAVVVSGGNIDTDVLKPIL